MRTIISEAYKHLLEYTGNPEQMFYAQRLVMKEGRAEHLEIIDVDNGSGLHFHILPGKGMDIGRLSFRGMNVSFLSKAGYSNSVFYESDGMNGIHTFDPGFLTTCGLRNSGLPCEIDGEKFGFHGRIGQTPSDGVSIQYDTGSETPSITVSGRVREGWLFGPFLQLYRQIRVFHGINEIHMKDEITNLSARTEPLMLLYHFNVGYPFLTEDALFVTSHVYEKPVDAYAKKHEPDRGHFGSPEAGVPECCYYYRQTRNNRGESFAACINQNAGFGVMICTDPGELPLLCNWHSHAAGDYVMGIEPCSCYGDGRKAHMERNQMTDLLPYETIERHLVIKFVEHEHFENLIKENT